MGRSRQTTQSGPDAQTMAMYNQGAGNIRNLMAANPMQAYEGPFAAATNPASQEAISRLMGPSPSSPLLDQALSMAGTGFTPQPVTAEFSPQAIQSGFQASPITPGYEAQAIEAPQFAGADLNPYMNPFLDEVLDRSMADINRQRDIAVGQTGDAAMRAGAFGGSRHGVAQAETERAFADVGARTAAGLRSDAFSQAANLFGQDAARQLQAAQLGEQQRQFGAGLDMQSQLAAQQAAQFGAGQDLQAQMANMQAGQFGAGLGMQAQLANQQAQQFGAGLDLQRAGLLGSLGMQQGQMDLNRAMGLGQLGGQQQQFEQMGLDRAYQEFMRQYQDPFMRAGVEQGLLGVMPRGTTQTTTGSPGFLNSVLGVAQTAGNLGWEPFSDERLKTDIEPIGQRGGHNWYRFRYVWGGPVHEGVMAQEVLDKQPEAVILDDSGFYRVNYEVLQ